jgi:predicted ATPase
MQRPTLKSIHPVNLLSFGPSTEPIELRQLNILIGPNGSGKSNLIEAVRLLHVLQDRDPWSSVLATGGVEEWLWKGGKRKTSKASITTVFALAANDARRIGTEQSNVEHSITVEKVDSSFTVQHESIRSIDDNGLTNDLLGSFDRTRSQGSVHQRKMARDDNFTGDIQFALTSDRSILSQLASPSLQQHLVGNYLPELYEIAEFLESFDFHQDWEFGVHCSPRDPQPVGQSVKSLDEDGSNLAQMLAYYRDDHKRTFEILVDMVRRFYEPAKSLEIRLISTHLQVAVEETSGFSTPASRLSDGMLRWLAILAVLLNPNPAPVTCIDEPELGLHPDIIPTLADLLRDASTRTQLIVTTHSSALVDAFTNAPESVCICENIQGSTVIRRLQESQLAVWLKDYSLGSLWTSGEIGGNRW